VAAETFGPLNFTRAFATGWPAGSSIVPRIIAWLCARAVESELE
jgi:hypothetical protein